MSQHLLKNWNVLGGIKGIELLDRKDLKLTQKNIGGFGKKIFSIKTF
jgi:hypothetical protein